MNSQRQWRAARDRPRTPVQLEDLHANAALRGILIESRIPGNGRLRFIEVKGRASGAATLSVARNEILCSLNRPEDYILGISVSTSFSMAANTACATSASPFSASRISARPA